MPNQEKPTYIIGHKNPDADSICSAIAYAAFKKRIGEENCVAARCGNSNARIDAVLERFEQPLPQFISDVTPRVRDIMVTDVHLVKTTNTCAETLEIIDEYDVRAVPVLDDDKLAGIVSIFHLGEYFVPKPSKQRQMRHVRTSIHDIVRSLKADVLNLINPDPIEDLYVRVGAMDIRSFGKFTEEEQTPARQSIIVVGDRYDIQHKSIMAGVRLLVITGGLEIDPEVLEMAKERDISLIVSPYDSATTSWVIRSATRVDRLADKEVVSFRPDEKLSGVKRKMTLNYAPIYMVTDDDDRLVGIFSRSDIIRPVPTKLILVDHNEMSQAVNGANEVTVTEIIDHHRLGSINTEQPILFINEPVGSTCTIVADMFRRHRMEVPQGIAGVLMAGIVADTLNLNSPTSTSKDKEILGWLSDLAMTQPQDLAETMFRAGSIIISHSPEEIIRADMKTYHEGSARYSVSQVEELGFENFWDRQESIAEGLDAVRKEEGLLFASILITDINAQNSLLAVSGDAEIINNISYTRIETGEIFDLPGIVSRKKQLIPYLTSLIRSLGLAEEGA